MDELRLIKKIQRSGDRSAADELVQYYYDEIYGFVKKQVSNAGVALDLTQEIFISMLRTIGFYDVKRGAGFRTWLYRIATNKVVDWFRSRAYHMTAKTIPLDEVEPIDETDFTQQFEDSDFTKKVCAFVGGTSPDTQKIFRLHIFGGYTFSEIAGIEGLPEGSVKSKYYRLINLLRKEFADYG
ncbi:RNA polymerase sigma factor [Cohnella boryungensis]|uniref:RNA polymerase sigma factor n=1 Tax=Cohnella boryungensis TaxID=768479 RepID=A0ABV8SEG4_9BACL